MSRDYTASLCVGFSVDLGDLWEVFTDDLAETQKSVPNFDPRTGERRPDKFEVDRKAGLYLKERFCKGGPGSVGPLSETSLLEELNGLNDKEFASVQFTATFTDFYDGETGEEVVVGPPALADIETVSMVELLSPKTQEALENVRAFLEKWGIRTKHPARVFSVMTVS